MDSFQDLDLNALGTEKVSQYVEQIIDLDLIETSSSALSMEKAKNLLILSQKLLAWFNERHQTLQHKHDQVEFDLAEAENAMEKLRDEYNCKIEVYKDQLQQKAEPKVPIQVKPELKPRASDLDVYRNVNRATVSVQAIIRGFLARRQFRKMIEALVFSDS